MPRRSKFRLPPLDFGGMTLGQRVARARKQVGHTQVELAQKMGLQQNLISAYETGRLRISAEMIVRIAEALKISTDELFGLKGKDGYKPSLKIARRMKKIETLRPSEQKTLLKTIDALLRGARK